MKIITKFALNNLKEKKARAFLIILAISLSSAMFFASLSIADTVEKMAIDNMKKYYGSAQITINQNASSPSMFFYMDGVNSVLDKIEYKVGTVRRSGIYRVNQKQQIYIDMQGFDLNDLQIMNPIQIIESYDIDKFTGKEIIIGTNDAQKYGFKLGDTIDIELLGRKHKFKVVAIAVPTGLFRPIGASNTITSIVPRDTMAKIYGGLGKVSQVYIKVSNEADIPYVMNVLSKEYSRYTVRKTYTEAEIGQQTKEIRTPFLLMLLVVSFISAYIIYSSFNVIALERLPVIGTFRSVGATKKMTDILLLVESILYGVIGGVFGLGLGLIILRVMTNVLSANPYSSVQVNTEMIFSGWYIIVAFFGAIVLTVFSSIIPIVKVSKKPIRDIVLGNIVEKSKSSKIRYIIGLMILCIATLLPRLITGGDLYVQIIAISMILLPIAVVIIIPIIIKIVARFFEFVFQFIFGNEGLLAVKNFKGNTTVNNSIALLTIGIASLLMITTLSSSIADEVMNIYNKNNYDLVVTIPRADQSIIQRLRAVGSVDDTYGVYIKSDVETPQFEQNFGLVMGVQPDKYLEYFDNEMLFEKEIFVKQFNQGRNIVVSSTLRDVLDLKAGDSIIIKTAFGDRNYTIMGFMHNLWNNGNIAIVPERYLKQDMKIEYISEIYVKSRNPQLAALELRDRFSRENIWLETKVNLERMNIESNNQILNLLTGFSLLALVIGVFGIINNYIISFISRRRDISVLRSIGMSKKQNAKILFVEALTGGLVGSMLGIIMSVSFLDLAKRFVATISFPLYPKYSLSLLMAALACGIVISIIASVSPMIKSSKLSIIDGIKYE